MNMAERFLEVKYKCLHQSCQIKKCKQGVLHIDESLFNQLSESFEDKNHFKSPRGYCRLGFTQTLQVVDVKDAGIEDEAEKELSAEEKALKRLTDPMELLKEEHNSVLQKLDLIEGLIKRRDLDGLWITVSEVEDDIALHSIEKEEGILFPMLEKASSLTSSEISIMKEDHRELEALLNSVKDGLRVGDVLDEVFGSAVANLRNHIRKEDEEFFEVIDQCLDAEGKKHLLEEMAKAEKNHVKAEIGNRRDLVHISAEQFEKREHYEAAVAAARLASVKDEGCC